jgi:hypothetical protein
MAVTNADILGWLNANPGADAALINQTMAEAGVSASQYQSATGAPPPPVAQAVAPQGMLSGPAPSAPTPSAPAVSNADILGWFNANPNASDALIAKTMQEAGVSPVRLAQVTGAPVAEVVNRFQAATAPTVAAPVAPSNPKVTNADILGWFNANPNADATLINQTMQAAGVSPTQVSSALKSNPEIAQTYLTQQILGQGTADKWTGEGKGSAQANAADMAKILAGIGITDINQFGQITKQVPVTYTDENGTSYDTGQTQTVTTYGNKVTGQEVPNTYSERQTGNAFGGTFAGKGNTGYRVEMAPNGTPIFYTTGASSSDADQWMPIVQLALAATGAGGLLGNALLGTGASQVAAGALGGGLLGGGLSALAGQDILKGALLGGAGGAIAGYFSPSTGQITNTPVSADSVPFTQADYSLATGVGPQGLESMGGAQGLQPGTSANLPNMGGAQGITLNLGPASTSLANALSTFGGMNPANLDAMGGAQGLTYQTPTGLVTQGGVIPTGGSTGNNNVIGETGVNTAYNIGNGIGDTLAKVDTGVYNPAGGLLSPPVTSTAPTGSILDNLTPSQIANIAGGVGGLIGGAGIARAVTPKTTPMGVSIPTQGVPLNTADYYRAIQQNYNRLLPAVPRDVATPLAQWYNSTYGA